MDNVRKQAQTVDNYLEVFLAFVYIFGRPGLAFHASKYRHMALAVIDK